MSISLFTFNFLPLQSDIGYSGRGVRKRLGGSSWGCMGGMIHIKGLFNVACIPVMLVVTMDGMLVGVLLATVLLAVSEMEYVLSSSTGVAELFIMV